MKSKFVLIAFVATAAFGLYSSSFAAPQVQAGAHSQAQTQASAQSRQVRRERMGKRAMLLASLAPDERMAVIQIAMIERALRQSNRGNEVRAFYQDTLARTSNVQVRSLIDMRLLRLDVRENGPAATLPQMQQKLGETLSRLR